MSELETYGKMIDHTIKSDAVEKVNKLNNLTYRYMKYYSLLWSDMQNYPAERVVVLKKVFYMDWMDLIKKKDSVGKYLEFENNKLYIPKTLVTGVPKFLPKSKNLGH